MLELFYNWILPIGLTIMFIGAILLLVSILIDIYRK
jgi:hypothetical protein